MRDSTHKEFIEEWANFVRDNPKKWRKFHTNFINTQIRMHREFLDRFLKYKGSKAVIELYGIKNINGYKKLLKIK